jgi:hypothetical protein
LHEAHLLFWVVKLAKEKGFSPAATKPTGLTLLTNAAPKFVLHLWEGLQECSPFVFPILFLDFSNPTHVWKSCIPFKKRKQEERKVLKSTHRKTYLINKQKQSIHLR